MSVCVKGSNKQINGSNRAGLKKTLINCTKVVTLPATLIRLKMPKVEHLYLLLPVSKRVIFLS